MRSRSLTYDRVPEGLAAEGKPQASLSPGHSLELGCCLYNQSPRCEHMGHHPFPRGQRQTTRGLFRNLWSLLGLKS